MTIKFISQEPPGQFQANLTKQSWIKEIQV